MALQTKGTDKETVMKSHIKAINKLMTINSSVENFAFVTLILIKIHVFFDIYCFHMVCRTGACARDMKAHHPPDRNRNHLLTDHFMNYSVRLRRSILTSEP